MFSGPRPRPAPRKLRRMSSGGGEGAGGQHPHSKACLLRPWGQEGGLSDLQQVEGEQTRKPAASNPLPTKPGAAVHCPPGWESRVHTPPAAHHREPFPLGGWGGCPLPPPLLNGISCAQCGPRSKSAADLTRVHTGAGRPAGSAGAAAAASAGLTAGPSAGPLGGSLVLTPASARPATDEPACSLVYIIRKKTNQAMNSRN